MKIIGIMMLWMWIWCVLKKLCCLKMILMSTLQIFSDQKKVVSKTASKKTTPVKKAPASNRVKVASIKPIQPIKSQSLSKEDMAIVDYSHQEMGLSRPCLRRYNYDVLESREHIPLTCNGKNFFIPIVPDKIRNKEEREN